MFQQIKVEVPLENLDYVKKTNKKRLGSGFLTTITFFLFVFLFYECNFTIAARYHNCPYKVNCRLETQQRYQQALRLRDKHKQADNKQAENKLPGLPNLFSRVNEAKHQNKELQAKTLIISLVISCAHRGFYSSL